MLNLSKVLHDSFLKFYVCDFQEYWKRKFFYWTWEEKNETYHFERNPLDGYAFTMLLTHSIVSSHSSTKTEKIRKTNFYVTTKKRHKIPNKSRMIRFLCYLLIEIKTINLSTKLVNSIKKGVKFYYVKNFASDFLIWNYHGIKIDILVEKFDF